MDGIYCWLLQQKSPTAPWRSAPSILTSKKRRLSPRRICSRRLWTRRISLRRLSPRRICSRRLWTRRISLRRLSPRRISLRRICSRRLCPRRLCPRRLSRALFDSKIRPRPITRPARARCRLSKKAPRKTRCSISFSLLTSFLIRHHQVWCDRCDQDDLPAQEPRHRTPHRRRWN